MTKFHKFLLTIGKMYLGIAVIIVPILSVCGFIYLLLPVQLQLSIQLELFGRFLTLTPPIGEYSAADSDHRAIANWIAQCIGAKSLNNLPNETADILSSPFRDYRSSTPDMNNIKRQPNSVEKQLVYLSNNIVTHRVDAAQRWHDSYKLLQIVTWFAIIIGLMTTVFASLNSTDFGKGDSGAAKSIRVLAILFPAIGTAAAAVIAFYGPRDEMGRASHLLASLMQLHTQIVSNLGTLNCSEPDLAAAPSKLLSSRLLDWNRRYLDILAVAESGASGEQGQAGGGAAPQSKSQ